MMFVILRVKELDILFFGSLCCGKRLLKKWKIVLVRKIVVF